MSDKKMINEIMGVPRAINDWVYLLSNTYINIIHQLTEEEGWVNKDSYSEERISKTYDADEIIIETSGMGSNEFINSKMFKDLPLNKTKLTIRLMLRPYYVKKGRFVISAGYNPEQVSISKIGDSITFDNNAFALTMYVPHDYIMEPNDEITKELVNEISPIISHELLHSYQIYTRLLTNEKNNSFGKDHVVNKLFKSLHKKMRENSGWSDFLRVLYLSMGTELDARVTQLYYELKSNDVKTQEEAMDILKKSTIWQDYNELKRYNEKSTRFRFETDSGVSWDDAGKSFGSGDIRNELYLTVVNSWDETKENIYKELEDKGMMVSKLPELPQKVKEKPQLFFKLFESGFHKKGEKLRRKLIKVISLVLLENTKKEDN